VGGFDANGSPHGQFSRIFRERGILESEPAKKLFKKDEIKQFEEPAKQLLKDLIKKP
jgi:hypothetical protein